LGNWWGATYSLTWLLLNNYTIAGPAVSPLKAPPAPRLSSPSLSFDLQSADGTFITIRIHFFGAISLYSALRPAIHICPLSSMPSIANMKEGGPDVSSTRLYLGNLPRNGMNLSSHWTASAGSLTRLSEEHHSA
jgi:hypothetical protein